MVKSKDVREIHYQEIPSFRTNDNGEFYVSRGIHVVICYQRDNYRKLFISEQFKTNFKDYNLKPSMFSVYDMLAFHVFRYVKERCNFSTYKQELQMLWTLLKYSNGFRQTLKKFTILLFNYYDKIAKD